mmetsp:Transcript_22001/g.39570  ORF Transcript_22001/g.39570 Transcript_22001/m.39570 type:complete len:524 (-) Transcript_22001:1762-3333(-)
MEGGSDVGIGTWIWKGCASLGLISCSGLFSGLTLGVLGQDITQLHVYAASGSESEQRNAKKMLPVRKKGNLLLCTLLLGNVAVNSALSILMSEVTGGLIGLIASTAFIVIFGEIVPQAICSRHGLVIGAFLAPIVQLFMVLLFVVAKPISLILDLALGRDMGQIFDKNELSQLLDVHAEREGETGISSGETKLMKAAMEFTTAMVQDIMTAIEDVYMLEVDTRLDDEVMTAIWQTGHSRVPVYDKDRNCVCGVLFVKDLILVNFDDNMTVRTLLHFYPREVHMVFGEEKLPNLLKYFKTGKGHLAIVRSVNSSGDGDPFWETVGIVTLEDVIEYLIREEIVDETDVYIDTHTKQRVQRSALGPMDRTIRMTPMQLSACASFLNNSVKSFNQDMFDVKTVTRIVAEAVVLQLKPRTSELGLKWPLYEPGQPSEVFTVVLSGKVVVKTGRDNFHCLIGAWECLGEKALTEQKYIPDFTATVCSECSVLQISRHLYRKALTAYVTVPDVNRSDAALPLYSDDLGSE